MGDGRAEGSSAIRNRGQAAISLTPDIVGTHVRIFESSYVGELYCTPCMLQSILGTRDEGMN